MLVDALLKIMEVARILGLSENDLKSAKDYLVHNELGLCFDTIITQLYEYDIEIDNKDEEIEMLENKETTDKIGIQGFMVGKEYFDYKVNAKNLIAFIS